jgi:hypothetical protein
MKWESLLVRIKGMSHTPGVDSVVGCPSEEITGTP